MTITPEEIVMAFAMSLGISFFILLAIGSFFAQD